MNIEKAGYVSSNSLVPTGATQPKQPGVGFSCEDSIVLGKFNGVEYSKLDITSNGLLPVIVQSNDVAKLEGLKNQVLSLDPDNKIKFDLKIIKGFAAFIDPSSEWKIEDKGVTISLDGKVSIPPEPKEDNSPESRLDVAIPTLGVEKLWEKGFTGKGVTIALVDTGIQPHKDFEGRIKDFKDIVNGKNGKENAYDDQGHGTHCTGDAIGNGTASEGKYKGPAYEADIVGVKVLNAYGSGSFSDVIKGIEYVVEKKDELNISVMSMSLGGTASVGYEKDTVCQAVKAAADKGILPVIAAGNSGPSKETIGTPAITPYAMSVAALDDAGTPQLNDDSIAYFSSRGPTKYDKLSKPDISTPGVKIMATNNKGGYSAMSGTSMATPIMAGLAACLFQVKPGAKADEIKDAVYTSARKLDGVDQNTQGYGVANPIGAFEKLTQN